MNFQHHQQQQQQQQQQPPHPLLHQPATSPFSSPSRSGYSAGQSSRDDEGSIWSGDAIDYQTFDAMSTGSGDFDPLDFASEAFRNLIPDDITKLSMDGELSLTTLKILFTNN
jgi:hypothetical protein